MAGERKDVSTVELSLFCRWQGNGLPEEHFLEIIYLHKANATAI